MARGLKKVISNIHPHKEKAMNMSDLLNSFLSVSTDDLAIVIGGYNAPVSQPNLGLSNPEPSKKCGNENGHGQKGSFMNAPGTAVTESGAAVQLPFAVCPKTDVIPAPGPAGRRPAV